MVSFALLGDKNTTLTWREDTGSKRWRHIYLIHRKLLGLVNYVTNMSELIITISPVLYAMCNAQIWLSKAFNALCVFLI